MKIIFTDLDGTLLDHDTYTFNPAKKVLTKLNKQKTPIIFCTSKTSKELLFWRKKTHNSHPFISENGGGIFIPLLYFSKKIEYTDKTDDFLIIRLGASISSLEQVLNELKEKYEITSFLDMSNQQLASLANLPIHQATLAKKREFSIPFILHDETKEHDLIDDIIDYDLNVTKGGRFYHLMGDNDKGKAVEILTSIYEGEHGNIDTIGIGDSENDFPMLKSVDRAYLVKKNDDSFASESFNHIDSIGPKGWNKIILKEFDL